MHVVSRPDGMQDTRLVEVGQVGQILLRFEQRWVLERRQLRRGAAERWRQGREREGERVVLHRRRTESTIVSTVSGVAERNRRQTHLACLIHKLQVDDLLTLSPTNLFGCDLSRDPTEVLVREPERANAENPTVSNWTRSVGGATEDGRLLASEDERGGSA